MEIQKRNNKRRRFVRQEEELKEKSFNKQTGLENLKNATKLVRNFVALRLPVINQQINKKIINNPDFIRIINKPIELLSNAVNANLKFNNISDRTARSIIQLIGFLVSSAEKHFQAQGAEKGTALSSLGDAESILLALSPIAKHPPRDTAYTYWIWNADQNALTFTGNEQEIKFNQVINTSDYVFKEACVLLRKITSGQFSIGSTQAVELIRQAAAKLAILRDDFMSLMRHKNGPHSERNFEPMFFMTEMRLYLISYPVGGHEWEGVSAANLASQMSIDYLIGTTDEDYFNHVRGRFDYFPAEEKTVLEEDMSSDSLLSVFLRYIGLKREDVNDKDEFFFKQLVNSQSSAFRESLTAYKALIKAASHLTASHWSLIDNYLLKPSKQLSDTEHAHLTVDPEKGTSGMNMDDVKRIREMRRNHNIATKLVECL